MSTDNFFLSSQASYGMRKPSISKMVPIEPFLLRFRQHSKPFSKENTKDFGECDTLLRRNDEYDAGGIPCFNHDDNQTPVPTINFYDVFVWTWDFVLKIGIASNDS